MPTFYTQHALLPEGIRPQVRLEFTDEGVLQAVGDTPPGLDDSQLLAGLACPGFVNAHCHLELSHMQGQIPEGTGMVDFIMQLQNVRHLDTTFVQQQAQERAIKDMKRAGIVAVGDISNTRSSFAVKHRQTDLIIHTFLERYAQPIATVEEAYQTGLRDLEQAPLPHSLAPHAPYSVHQTLFDRIYTWNLLHDTPTSLHLLESRAEREIFEQRSGPFAPFFAAIQQSIEYEAHSALEHALGPMHEGQHAILVHLTELTAEELTRLNALEKERRAELFFCLCPCSNLFIHGRLPNFAIHQPSDPRLCVGTDSLASNWSLEMLPELKTLAKHWPEARLLHLLRMATENGAAALKLEHQVGSFTPGLTPGLLQLNRQSPEPDAPLSQDMQLERLI